MEVECGGEMHRGPPPSFHIRLDSKFDKAKYLPPHGSCVQESFPAKKSRHFSHVTDRTAQRE